MKILVTGGAGCIGSDLSEALLARGHDVTVLDNLSSGTRDHLRTVMQHPRLTFVEGDMLEIAQVSAAVEGQDMVYHLAANPDVRYSPGDATDKDLRQNLIATYNLLESARRCAVKRIAFASTSAVYGMAERQPIPEDYPLRPISLYGATKAGCESLLSAFHNLFGIQCWVFRFANIVGSKTRTKGGTVISDFVTRLRVDPGRLAILGNGKQEKSYLLSRECVDAMLHVVDRARDGFNVFNLGCDDTLRVVDIADMVADALGLTSVEYTFSGGEGGWLGDVPRFQLDVSAVNRLGWRAALNSKQAVASAIADIVRANQETVCGR